jgi:CubicO group peptidase (beta-lactamase class C family)
MEKKHFIKEKFFFFLLLGFTLNSHSRSPSSNHLNPQNTHASEMLNKLEEKTLAEEVIKKIKEELPDMLTQASIPGAAVAVVDDWNVVWEKAYGNVDTANARPVDMNTIFSIQSMSKSFTALAVLMAVQDGMVELDTPIKEYLPDFTVNSLYDKNPEKIITLRHLLSQWSGLTHEAPFGSNQDDRYDFTKHIESISSTWLRYPVGYRYSYSNLGIDLAGYILQVRSGKPFAEYVKEKVLDAIGMSNSHYDMAVIKQANNRAIGHANNRIPPLRIPMIPAGGLYTNINDMVKYVQFHMNKGVVKGRRILRADLTEQMHTIQFARSRQRFGYCLGLIRGPLSDFHFIYHAGGGYGFSSIMVMFPKKKIGAVLLTNSENESVIWSLINMVIESISEKCGEAPVEEPGIERMTKLDPKNPRVQAVIGRYGDDFAYIIEMRNDTLVLRMTPQNNSYPLTFYDDDGELVGLFGNFSEVRFLPPYHGRRGSVMRIDRRLSDSNFNIKDFNDSPTDPPGPDKPHWSEYVGDYEHLINGKPNGIFHVTIRNGYLYAAECKCTEHKRGLFFTYDGLSIDFTSDPPTASYTCIRKKE